MDERLDHHGWYSEDYGEEDLQHIEGELFEILIPDYPDPEFFGEEEYYEESTQEELEGPPDLVEHQMDHAAVEAAHLYAEARFGWKYRARLRRQGKFVPPDIRGYSAPAFVRVADLQKKARGEGPDGGGLQAG